MKNHDRDPRHFYGTAPAYREDADVSGEGGHRLVPPLLGRV